MAKGITVNYKTNRGETRNGNTKLSLGLQRIDGGRFANKSAKIHRDYGY